MATIGSAGGRWWLRSVLLDGPLGAATVGAGVALAAMHLAVGATLIVGIGRTLRLDGREQR